MSGPLYSWGRYPAIAQHPHTPAWRAELPPLLDHVRRHHATTLPFGNGRSYGDSALAASGHVLYMRGLNRIIAADWTEGIVRAEAGLTLSALLGASIPRGWFLPVTPGTQFVTLGGAIANDVHGKNHHRRGTFGCHITAFGLLRDGDELTCTPASHPELFAATIGGLGLTGILTWAEIRLMPVLSSQINETRQRFGNLDEFFALSEELDARHEYAVAWIDCRAQGKHHGRGVYFVGDHAEYGTLDLYRHGGPAVPFTPPVSLVNSWTLAAFNTAYWHAHPSAPGYRRQRFEHFFYPLDRIAHWNRIYGRRGFQQFQCVVPSACARPALAELLHLIVRSASGSFLAVLKRCGEIPSPGLLSFPLPGVSLALDFPNGPALAPLFARMDALVHEAGGRLYPAKDAHMQGSDFRRGYPAWEQLERLRDPGLMSRFWQRVLT